MDWTTWKAQQEQRRRHDEVLELQRRQHDEQLAALKAKSARELAVDRQREALEAISRDLHSRSANLDAHYSQRWDALKAELEAQHREARAGTIAEAREFRQQLVDWADTASSLFAARHGAQDARSERLRRLHELNCDGIDRLRRMQGLPPIEADSESPDEKASHREDVEADVAAAAGAHKELH